jgi:hypothetical protein
MKRGTYYLITNSLTEEAEEVLRIERGDIRPRRRRRSTSQLNHDFNQFISVMSS